jgi:DNA polymerase I-like protein with 3'-5' exonuclease and polymerase domains
MYSKLMFLRQADDSISFQKEWMKSYKFHLVTSVDQLEKLVDMCIQKKLYSIDLETTGVDNRVYPDEYFEDGVTTRHGKRTVDKVVGICISFDGVNGYYTPLSHYPEDSGNLPWDPSWDQIERLVNSGSKAIFHNFKFDAEFMYPLTNKDLWRVSEFEDTYLVSKTISPIKSNPNGLKQLTKIHFGIDMIELDELFSDEMMNQLKRDKQSYNFAVLHPREGTAYGCSDGIFTYKLFPILHGKFVDNDQSIYDLEKSFCNVLRKLERNRVHIDVHRLLDLEVKCKEASQKVGDIIRSIIESETGQTGKWRALNIGSPSQMSVAMFTDQEGMKLKPIPEMLVDPNGEQSSGSDDDDDDDGDDDSAPAKKQYSLKDEILKALHRAYGHRFLVEQDHDGEKKKESIFELILEYRHYEKMLGSYLNPLMQAVDKNGDVRPNFNQLGTDTARLSSRAGKIEQGYSGINFQGIPRDSDEDKPELFKQIRTIIIPRPGWILAKLDFAGEELRVVTNLSGDPIWTDSFLNKDGDVHSITSRTLFGKKDVNKDERNRGKRCNFAFIYGGGAGAIQRNVGCSMEDAQRHMDNLKNDVPVLMGYVDHQKMYAKKHKCIYTSFGRRIPINNIDSPIRALRSKAERCAINYTIQGTSADILKFAMCFVDKNIRERKWENVVRYVLTVHDEVVFEIRPDYLMEVVRLLDEWMTRPWQLEKVHGREWVVPLLTEPGVDFNWKARYNYFEMVDGVPVDPSNVDPDGKYTGKIKKGHYFHNGKMYQEIPDFLKEYIHRGDQAKSTQETLDSESPESSPLEEEPELEDVTVGFDDAVVFADPTPDAIIEPPKEQVAASGYDTLLEEEDTQVSPMRRHDVDLGEKLKSEAHVARLELAISNLSKNQSQNPEIKSFPPEVQKTSETVRSSAPADFSDLDSNDTTYYDYDLKKDIPLDKPATIPPPPKVEPAQKEAQKEAVFRWIIKCVLSVQNAQKLKAVCLLAEGDTLLRVVQPTGEILIDEEQGVRIDKDKFSTLSNLFGLG